MKIKLSIPATIFKTEYNAIQRLTNLMHTEGRWYGKQLHLVSHNWPEVSIGAEPFVCGFHQWSRVWTEYLRPHSLGVVILRSVHVRCSEQGCSEVTRHSTAEAPRNTWDSFYLELEYMFDDFVFRNFLLLTILFFLQTLHSVTWSPRVMTHIWEAMIQMKMKSYFSRAYLIFLSQRQSFVHVSKTTTTLCHEQQDNVRGHLVCEETKASVMILFICGFTFNSFSYPYPIKNKWKVPETSSS